MKANVRGTVFEYDSFDELQRHLTEIDSERDFALPDDSGVRDGEWRTYDYTGEQILRVTYNAGVEEKIEGVKIDQPSKPE